MICKFIKKGIVFILPLTILPAIIGLGYYLHRPDSLSLPDASRKILILGDSHTECGINDSLFPIASIFQKAVNPICFAMLSCRCWLPGKRLLIPFCLVSIPGVFRPVPISPECISSTLPLPVGLEYFAGLSRRDAFVYGRAFVASFLAGTLSGRRFFGVARLQIG